MLFSWETISLFLIASIGATLAPGPDNLFVLSIGMMHRRKEALFAAWGMVSGISIHTTLVTLGISSIILASEVLFVLLKIAGAGYLLYLAFQSWRTRNQGFGLTAVGQIEKGIWVMFRRGFLMNVLNPKVGLFFIAFLPQFVDLTLSNANLQMMVLGLIFMVQAFVLFTIIALCASILGVYLNKKPSIKGAISILTSILFTGIALKLLFA